MNDFAGRLTLCILGSFQIVGGNGTWLPTTSGMEEARRPAIH